MHQDVPDPEPDEGAILCGCCPEHRPRSERRGDVLLCPVCDFPTTTAPKE